MKKPHSEFWVRFLFLMLKNRFSILNSKIAHIVNLCLQNLIYHSLIDTAGSSFLFKKPISALRKNLNFANTTPANTHES